MKKLMTAINKFTTKISCVALFAMMMISIVDVIGRYFFNKPITGTTDIVELLMVIAVYMGLAWDEEIDMHIKVDLLYNKYTPKVRACVDLFTRLIGLVGFGLVSWRLFTRALSAFQRHNILTDTLEINVGPFLVIASIGSAFLCLVLIVKIGTYVREIAGKGGKRE